ncbi:MAG: hypothetical protein R3E67_07450 [Pseudomonadales bacterium]
MALLQISEPGMSPAPHMQTRRRRELRHNAFTGGDGAQRLASDLPDGNVTTSRHIAVRYFADGSVEVGKLRNVSG